MLLCTHFNLINYLTDFTRAGDIRLVGGSYSWEGRVEIYMSGAWGTVGENSARTNEARVVCRQLGYETYSK